MKITLNELTEKITTKTFLLTDSNNVVFLKREIFNLGMQSLIKVYSLSEFYKKVGVRPISSLEQKMYFFKALKESGITEYNEEILDDIVKTYKEEEMYDLKSISSTPTYELYKQVLDIYDSYQLEDSEFNLKYLKEKGDLKFNLITYNLFLTKTDEKIIANLKTDNFFDLVISKEVNYNYYSGTDLYNEVMFAAAKIKEINSFEKCAIAANNIDNYISYIDLIFNENKINYNYNKTINTAYIDYLLTNIKQNSEKKEFLMSFYNMFKETPYEETYDFLVGFIDTYDKVFDDSSSFVPLLKHFRKKTFLESYTNSVDIVNIADLNSSYDHVFILGVNMGEMASTKYANLFIKTNELKKIYSNYELFLNVKKHQFKLDKALPCASNIYLTSHKIDKNNTKAEVDPLILHLDIKTILKENDELFSNLGATYRSKANLQAKNKIDVTNVNSIALSFDSLNLSPSKLDTYNKCHFSFYCKYLLKLDEEYVEFDNRHIGSYVHLLFEKAITSDDFKSEFKLVEETYKEKFNNQIIKFLIEKITENITLLYPIVKNEIDKNDFNVKYREINLKNDPLVIEINGITLNVSGIIDRVDESATSFRIVDYKTGSKEINLNEMLLGINLQLFIYMVYLEKKYNKRVSGIFYQKALINFSTSEKYLLDGLLLNDEEELLNYGADEIGEFLNVISRDKLNPKKVLSEKKFKLLSDYTIFKIKEAGNLILSGDIAINPVDKTCEYCPYQTICGIEKKSKRVRYINNEEDVFERIEGELNGVY